MVRGKSEYEWRKIASLRAGIANGQMKKKGGKLWMEDDFDPFAKHKKAAGTETLKLSGKHRKAGFAALRRFV